MKVGYVILNFNDSKTVIRLLQCLKKLNNIDEICIVDNQSTDNSYAILKQFESEKIKCIRSSHNRGYSAGNNLGARFLFDERNVDIVFISNPDVIVNQDLIDNIISTYKSESYSVVTGIMKYPNGSIVERPIRYINTYWGDLIDCFYFGRKISYRHTNGIVNDLMKRGKYRIEVECVPGSFFAISKESFQAIGGFDEGVFLYYEETILGKKLLNKQLKSCLLLNVDFIHDHSSSISKTYSVIKKRKIQYQSAMYYHRAYNHINRFQQILLLLCMKISIAEFYVIETVKSLCGIYKR